MGKVSIKDIAKQAATSITTVSLVLNDKPCRVSEKKRKLILETAKKLNYFPNPVAVSLVTGKSKTLGLIVSDINNSFFSNLAKGVATFCDNNNWSMMLCNSFDKHIQDSKYIEMLRCKGIDGLIFGMAADTTVHDAKKCIKNLELSKLPFVMVDRYIETDKGDIVCVNHFNGGYMAIEYLHKCGHEKIAIITGPMNLIDSVERYKGAMKYAHKNKIKIKRENICEGRYTYESGVAAMDKLLENNCEFTGVFAFNDLMAIGAIKSLSNHGINVPKDVSVIGYDDIFMAQITDVPLTTIHQPVVEIGYEAAKLIINNNSVNEKIVLEPKLVIRESVKIIDKDGINV